MYKLYGFYGGQKVAVEHNHCETKLLHSDVFF